ncbi:hypothetical protein MBM_02894 [Drepanopeziza brunnea f. sp. 'multigermtubi' MB_m1]|uniref:Uncharacterized protein n=1 Tax=Marssonina brunnea f. sp. multigermtubi (strain MB_m1) TaxID=1072389 RepID=K1X118_MARBU|nr:uncharacterized protein MBM_02894 [Drepanopeziza brunnea f. sp. 'multigermtubi' MB_m1]EKD18652.1 hypothetical protein MBM_02894 [Drepanopeziza brunnea f. sp. 'multigermtubi' MB_m1]
MAASKPIARPNRGGDRSVCYLFLEGHATAQACACRRPMCMYAGRAEWQALQMVLGSEVQRLLIFEFGQFFSKVLRLSCLVLCHLGEKRDLRKSQTTRLRPGLLWISDICVVSVDEFSMIAHRDERQKQRGVATRHTSSGPGGPWECIHDPGTDIAHRLTPASKSKAEQAPLPNEPSDIPTDLPVSRSDDVAEHQPDLPPNALSTAAEHGREQAGATRFVIGHADDNSPQPRRPARDPQLDETSWNGGEGRRSRPPFRKLHLNFLSLLYLRTLRDIGNGGVSELSVTHARAVRSVQRRRRRRRRQRRDETRRPEYLWHREQEVIVIAMVVVVVVVVVVVAAARFHAHPDAEGPKPCTRLLDLPFNVRLKIEEAIITTEYSSLDSRIRDTEYVHCTTVQAEVLQPAGRFSDLLLESPSTPSKILFPLVKTPVSSAQGVTITPVTLYYCIVVESQGRERTQTRTRSRDPAFLYCLRPCHWSIPENRRGPMTIAITMTMTIHNHDHDQRSQDSGGKKVCVPIPRDKGIVVGSLSPTSQEYKKKNTKRKQKKVKNEETIRNDNSVCRHHPIRSDMCMQKLLAKARSVVGLLNSVFPPSLRHHLQRAQQTPFALLLIPLTLHLTAEATNVRSKYCTKKDPSDRCPAAGPLPLTNSQPQPGTALALRDPESGSMPNPTKADRRAGVDADRPGDGRSVGTGVLQPGSRNYQDRDRDRDCDRERERDRDRDRDPDRDRHLDLQFMISPWDSFAMSSIASHRFSSHISSHCVTFQHKQPSRVVTLADLCPSERREKVP